ncbi:hypothetical protein SBRCBS47491_005538 [Sporothrix bragantina]|uniref:Glycosyltransferase 2 n=1 Tax=Sporothrix bragantina TaxID=671064 RepID=A0ABP0BYC1_9PEZI
MDTVQDRVREMVQPLFLSDVEMGKKDDDHLRASAGGGSSNSALRTSTFWNLVRVHPRKFFKRLLIVLVAGAVLLVFIKNLPTDLPVRDHRRPIYHGNGASPGRHQHQVPPPPPPPPPPAVPQRVGNKAQAPAKIVPDAVVNDDDEDDYIPPPPPPAPAPGAAAYNGQLRFLELAATLRSISNTNGGFLVNKNVLFAAGSLKSMATLLPLACQMGSELRSYVHFAIMSKSDISLADLQQLNGIDSSCNIFFHDARPDFASTSTNERMENSVDVAMTHIQLYMHPQVIIIDGTNAEEAYLQAGMRTFAKSSLTSLLELPKRGAKRLAWLTKLDSASLSNWNKINIDILIHAHAGASGSLIRLLKSMRDADFGGGSVPHLTIELPQKIDPPTERFLESFQWPPAGFRDRSGTRQLSLRRRIPGNSISEEESSVRFLESFWPSDPSHSHVLVLSPQTELAGDFFHYIKYALLEYRYSNPALMQEWDKRLFGLSLDLPRKGLGGTSKFAPPAPLKKAGAAGEAAPDVSGVAGDTSFLWQAPNSNAVLFLGERWAELHSFVAHMLDAQRKDPTLQPPAKSVSKTFPSWLEHALQLCQARGLWTLYPSATTASALATVHDELYQPPEEYEDEVLAEAAEAGSNPRWTEPGEVRLGSKSLIEALPHGHGGLPPFSDLPLLAWEGKQVSLADLDSAAQQYATHFRRTMGGCSEGWLKLLLPETLFCTEIDD